MQHQQKLLLNFMTLGLLLFYGITAAPALTPQEIAEIALDSTTVLVIKDTSGRSKLGSGFVVREGQIATNYHVIEGISSGFAKLVGETTEHPIELVRAVDKKRDLAIVKVSSVDAPALPLGDSDAVQVGETIYVAGNPQGLEGTFSEGIISAIRPGGNSLVDGRILQITAAISPGSSGGPVLNSSGEVIGISVGQRVGGQNLNFAIPVNYLKTLFTTTADDLLITEVHGLYSGSVSVDFSPDGRYIATGETDGDVGLWEVGNDEAIYYKHLGGEVKGVAFSPDGKYLAADGAGSVYVVLLEVSSGREVRRSEIHDDASDISSVAYSPNGRYMAIAVNLRWAFLWDLNSGRRRGWSRPDASEVYAVAFSPDGKYLATGNDDGEASLWEVSSWWTDDVNAINMKPGGNVRAVAFSPDGRYLAADGYDGSDTYVTIYNVSNGRIVWQIDSGNVLSIAFSPDGEYLAFGDADARITFYRIGANITKETVIVASGEVTDLAWSPDGTLISDGRTVWEITKKTDITVTSDITVSVSPSPVESPAIGEPLTLSLNIVGGETVAGYQATVAFDSTALRYVQSENGAFLPAGAFFIPPVVAGNQVTLASSAINAVSNGNGTLATLTFEVVAVKASTVTLSQVALVAPDGTLSTPKMEHGEITEPQQLVGDVNNDGVVNIQDLVLVGTNFGKTGDNDADVNGDGVINIVDLVLVAGAFGNTAAAPSPHSAARAMLSRADVQGWLAQARGLDLTDAPFQRGIIVLEQLLAALTPKETVLLPNYPNPFNPETWIPYHLAHPADVMITIYNTKGVVVRRLNLGHQPAGYYTARSKAGYWNGRNATGESVASGVYFYQLRAGDYSALRRMVIVK